MSGRYRGRTNLPRPPQHPNMTTHAEAYSRVLIDKALAYSGWNLLDESQVVFEYHNAAGRADYLLKDGLGRVLCVLEAKREDHDPYDAKEQARGYAENLNAPFVILSNGREHWFWNLERAAERDAYRIERLPSREDLERVRLKNLQPPKPLQTQIVRPDFLAAFNPDVLLRGYQIRAMEAIAQEFDDAGKRQFLLEMATGTGKTLLCAALIRRFLLTRNAERVLFIVDRIELAKQTMEDFATILAEFKPVVFKTARKNGELLGSSVVVADACFVSDVLPGHHGRSFVLRMGRRSCRARPFNVGRLVLLPPPLSFFCDLRRGDLYPVTRVSVGRDVRRGSDRRPG